MIHQPRFPPWQDSDAQVHARSTTGNNNILALLEREAFAFEGVA